MHQIYLVMVIHCMLSKTKKELQVNPEWLHANIFHTRMEHWRALNVIIDNESGMNVISKTIVERLRLKM